MENSDSERKQKIKEVLFQTKERKELEDIDKIWAGIISAITGTGVYLSAVADFLIAGPILGVVAGFTLSYIVQTKTQKRAWKREFLLKNIDQIYGPLYNDSIALETHYNSMLNAHSYNTFQRGEWENIQNSYTYHMIEDEEFRKELDIFYLQIEMYNELVHDTRKKIMELVNRIGKKHYNVNVEKIVFIQKNESRSPTAHVNDCLLFDIHPKEALQHNTDFIIQIGHNVKNTYERIEMYEPKDFEKFEQVWTELITEVSKNDNVRNVRESLVKIHVKNLETRQELIKRINERQKL